MIRDTSRFKNHAYDLLVVGGGINGAAISHLAARGGMRVALLEKGDFASGTSSKSTKLLHGGIRYLENLEFGLVRESLRERYIQLKAAPHLVKELPFIIPVYKQDKRPLWMMKIGVFLYDVIAGSKRIKRFESLNIQETLRREPNLTKAGLKGAVLYYDTQMDDARICLENVLQADRYGADVANYAEVFSFVKENGKITGVRARDLISDKEFVVKAKKTVCALGPWTNALMRLDDRAAKKKVRTTKGVHIIYKEALTKNALLITHRSDERIFFVIPWKGHSLIGTTDTNFIGNPDKIEVSLADIEYLMAEARRVFPDVAIEKDKIIGTFAGLRPLIRKGGPSGRVSRRHRLAESRSGITYVIGGKFTTYRHIAEDFLKRCGLKVVKGDFTLYGGEEIKESPQDLSRKLGLDENVIRALQEKYGSRYKEVLDIALTSTEYRKRICTRPPIIMAQVIYSLKTEMAANADDILMRRLGIGYDHKVYEECFKAISQTVSSLSR